MDYSLVFCEQHDQTTTDLGVFPQEMTQRNVPKEYFLANHS